MQLPLKIKRGENMTDTNKKLGKRIQELRKLRGLTQSKLAELIEVEVVTISRIENGSRFPKKENLENIAKVLNVEIKDLFDFGHNQTKAYLTAEIQKMIKVAKLNDLKYIYNLLKSYFNKQ